MHSPIDLAQLFDAGLAEQLSKEKVAVLQAKCDAANVPRTGTKTKLVERLVNPGEHQKKVIQPAVTKTIKKSAKTKLSFAHGEDSRLVCCDGCDTVSRRARVCRTLLS